MNFATAKDFVDHFKEGGEEYHMPAVGELDEPITKKDLEGLAVVFLFHSKDFCGRSTQECLWALEASSVNDLLLADYSTERAYRLHKHVGGGPIMSNDWGMEEMQEILLWLSAHSIQGLRSDGTPMSSSPRTTCFSGHVNSLMTMTHPVGHTGFPSNTGRSTGNVLRPIALLRLSDCSLQGWDDDTVFTLPSTPLYLPSC